MRITTGNKSNVQILDSCQLPPQSFIRRRQEDRLVQRPLSRSTIRRQECLDSNAHEHFDSFVERSVFGNVERWSD